MTHKVLITTSGVGSRLGDLTRYTNKSLVRIGTKPAIAHIIESYPTSTHFVVTLGHFGHQVKDFISLAYPGRTVEYVEVPQYEGPGTSLGLSMLAAREVLQCPFIYHASDTLITEPVPVPDRNWIGVFRGSDTSQYASWKLQEGRMQFHEKGAIGTDLIHIGLVGVQEFGAFWEALERLYKANPGNASLNDCQTLSEMIAGGSSMDVVEYPVWHDIGNTAALNAARREHGSAPDDLDKSGEAIFILGSSVVKFFADPVVVENRAERGRLLKEFVPEMEAQGKHFYKYAYVPGELYSQVVQPEDFKEFLAWAQGKFWKEEREVDDAAFAQVCRSFYEDKTRARVAQFLEASNLDDIAHVINGEPVPSVQDMLAQVDFDALSRGLQSRFHGDFILENILKTKDGYCLIDWRQDFGGLLEAGDRYYDLAKLNHNLVVNHRIINQNQFSIQTDERGITIDILRPSTLVECQAVFLDFLRQEGYDAQKVQLLTALIWLNMAPLHHYPFNLFLYYFGKLNLWRSLR